MFADFGVLGVGVGEASAAGGCCAVGGGWGVGYGAGVSAVGLIKGFTLTTGIERVLLQDGNWLVGLSLLRVSPR